MVDDCYNLRNLSRTTDSEDFTSGSREGNRVLREKTSDNDAKLAVLMDCIGMKAEACTNNTSSDVQ